MAPKTQSAPAKKNILQRFLAGLDRFQQNHSFFGFPYAVVKKYGDDEAGYQAALITYYGFLSLFPLLIVATSVIAMIAQHNAALGVKLLRGINGYFPVLGNQLQTSIHSPNKTGLALIIGLLITLFGAKGVADAVQHALNHIWQVPRPKRPSFPKGPLKSLAIIFVGGIGSLAAAILSSYASALGHSSLVFGLSTLLSIVVLFGVFFFVFTFGTAAKRGWHDNRSSAMIAAIGFQVLQSLGGYLITHQLQNLKGAYGQFGFVLAILFWFYLQAQVFLYAAEVSTVKSLRLWPRSLTQDPLSKADKEAFRLYPQKEVFKPQPVERVRVSFDDKNNK